jgi:hypothetical protein
MGEAARSGAALCAINNQKQSDLGFEITVFQALAAFGGVFLRRANHYVG